MTIRYKCDSCGSTLNIKEELAGTDGKCPKCKTPFTVPQPSSAPEKQPEKSDKSAKSAGKKPARAKKKRAGRADDDFDPMAVLMGDGPSEAPAVAEERQPASPPLSDEEMPADLDLELSFDEDADEPPPKKAKQKRKRVQFDSDDEIGVDPSGSAAATAGSMLSAGASAGAKDLLTKTMEESRARASRVEEDEPRRDGPTIQDYLRELGPKGGAAVGGVLVAAVLLYYLAKGMYGGGMDLPDLGRVYGTVTLDGVPLPGAKISFTPTDRDLTVQGKERQRLRTATAITDDEGYYELLYAEGIRGAPITEHRVSIEKMDSSGQLVTPVAWSRYGDERVTVESGRNTIDFPLKPDPPEEPQGRRRQ